MNRYFFTGAIAVLVAGAVHCATIMGVEEATLRREAGSTPAEGGDVPGAEGSAEECIGEGCPCAGAADCKHPAFRWCVAGRCMECSPEPDGGGCDTVHYCLPGSLDAGVDRFNRCVPGCASDKACEALGEAAPYCVLVRHECVTCRSDADCPNLGERCAPAGVCTRTCDAGTQCQGERLCCNGLCVDPKTDIFNCNGCGNECHGDDAVCCHSRCKNKLTSPDACGTCQTICKDPTPACVGGRCSSR